MGNAEGDTVFVKTDCSTNQRLLDGQDDRYNLSSGSHYLTAYNVESDNDHSPFVTLTPSSYETCRRACYCGYIRDMPEGTTPYEACNRFTDEGEHTCGDLILRDYGMRTNIIATDNVALTSANMTVLKYWYAMRCDTPEGLNSTGDFRISPSGLEPERTLNWHWVPDDSLEIVQNPYDCFGDFWSIAKVINTFGYSDSPYGTVEFTYNHTTCQDEVFHGTSL